MNGNAARFLRLGVSLAGLVTLGWVLTGQAAKPVHHAVSLPTDWSHRHLIFSQPRSADQAARLSQDPRYMQQLYRRQQRLALPVALPDDVGGLRGPARPVPPILKVTGKKFKRDWSKDLGVSGSVGADNYPAKFSFDTTIAFCDAAATPDYTVFSTGLLGSASQATVVAYDNLYFNCTPGATPLTYWAYNTAGTLKTSPVLSLDGSQVAFVETNGGFGILVMLKWARGGTVTTPAVPSTVAPAAYPACVAPCMTQILLKDGAGVQTDDTTSSVYYDYTNDVAWVGGALGWLHKITGVFKGVPTEETHLAGVFPIQVNNATLWTSSPVYDRISNDVFLGDASGFLYRVDATTGAVTASGRLDFGTGIVESPVVDSGNGFVYAFASSDGTAACTGGVACSAVYKLTTIFGAGSTGAKVIVGNSLILGATPNPLYGGGFDSSYYDSVGANAATGNLYVCGNTGGAPALYQVPITAGALPASGNVVAQLATSATTPACSPVTDVPNQNIIGPGIPTERLFVSVTNDGLAAGCAPGGCIFNFVNTPWQPFTSYAVGQQVLSSQNRIETVMTAGTSAGVPPTWSTQRGTLNTDGNPGQEVVWINQGQYLGSTLPAWIPLHLYTAFKVRILDSKGNVEIGTTLGTSGATTPAWNTVPGGTTNDGSMVWTNVGALATFALPSTGGTSGIIIDNTVGSFTVVGGSQVYFSTLSDQPCGDGAGGCAVQASQLALQ